MKSVEFLKSRGVDVDKSLELFGDVETYNETIGEFIVGLTNKTNKLKDYIAAKDMTNYAIYAHSIKSDARYFGFTKLADLAYQHELKSKAGDLYQIYNDFNNLVALVNEALTTVQEYFQDSPDAMYAPRTQQSTLHPTLDIKPEVVTRPLETPQQEPVQVGVQQNVVKEPSNYAKKAILVVDDSNVVRNFTKRIFDGEYLIGVAKDGKEAIDILEANKDNENIAAMLLDLNMPKVDGFKVLEYMQEHDFLKKIPVSIISGDSSKETIDKAFSYPIVDMLSKPFNYKDVKRVVEKTLMYKELI